eukprot:TRINITY_DN17647_c1_g3_i1.p1 TRINITY_DN17647_c1_g3~~TRINITY_DN17647_c1_g3_i1.p1  ORF type:complete len:757 (+),score=247.09 TRINITY_DN17647_c1_g3_i1:96-2366(+)
MAGGRDGGGGGAQQGGKPLPATVVPRTAGMLAPGPLSEERRREMRILKKQAVEEITNQQLPERGYMGSKYKEIRRLGSGTFGHGKLCQDTHGHYVVVKVAKKVHDEFGDKQLFLEKKELWSMRIIRHFNVVAVYEAWIQNGGDDGRPHLHIAMEYCDSGDLGKLIARHQSNDDTVRFHNRVGELLRAGIIRRQKQPGSQFLRLHQPAWVASVQHGGHSDEDRQIFLSTHQELVQELESARIQALAEGVVPRLFPQELLESWLVQLLWGLYHIHKVGKTMHRDIKPDNIFLSCSYQIIKIGDFGLSGLQMVTGGEAISGLGTPLFMAPEMTGTSPYTDRVDTFAVGVTMYQAMSFAFPWEGQLPGLKYDKEVILGRGFAGEYDQAWGSLPRGTCPRFLRRQLRTMEIEPPRLPPEMAEPGLYSVVLSMLAKPPGLRPTVGQVLRSKRIEPIARRIFSVFQAGGYPSDSLPGCLSPSSGSGPESTDTAPTDRSDAPRDILAMSDDRHGNVLNPCDRVGSVLGPDGKLHYPCKTPGATVYKAKGEYTLRIRTECHQHAEVIGKLPPDGIVEVVGQWVEPEGSEDPGQVWFKVVNSGNEACSGWCISTLPVSGGGRAPIFDRVPDDQVFYTDKVGGPGSPLSPFSFSPKQENIVRNLSQAVDNMYRKRHVDPSLDAEPAVLPPSAWPRPPPKSEEPPPAPAPIAPPALPRRSPSRSPPAAAAAGGRRTPQKRSVSPPPSAARHGANCATRPSGARPLERR